MKKYLSPLHHVAVDNYPYGSHRTEAAFGLEFKPKKGFRTSFQTVNPKTSRLNAPKNSTYSDLIMMYKDEDSGHIKYDFFGFNGEREISEASLVIRDNWDLFTADMRGFLLAQLYVYYKAHLQAVVVYGGADKDKVISIGTPVLAEIARAYKDGNTWPDVDLRFSEIEALKPEGYNPFRVTRVV
jgi:hypothetical protein